MQFYCRGSFWGSDFSVLFFCSFMEILIAIFIFFKNRARPLVWKPKTVNIWYARGWVTRTYNQRTNTGKTLPVVRGGRWRTGPNPVRKCNWIRNCRPLKIHDDLYVLYFRWGGRASCASSSGPFDELPYINYTMCIVKFHRAISASLFLLSALLLPLF